MGVYVMEPRALDLIEPETPLDLPDLVMRLMEKELPVGSYLYDGYWLDIGRHDDYERAVREFKERSADFDHGPNGTARMAAPQGVFPDDA